MPSKVVLTWEDFHAERVKYHSKPHHQFLELERDPYNCPLVNAIKRAIPDRKLYLEVWMSDDDIVYLATEDAEYMAKLSKADQEAFPQFDRQNTITREGKVATTKPEKTNAKFGYLDYETQNWCSLICHYTASQKRPRSSGSSFRR